MKRCVLQIRKELHYRRDAFESGVQENGFTIIETLRNPDPEDLLVIWNRYGPGAEFARIFERAGATVLVAENGYLGKAWQGDTFYAISKSQHNGAGIWPDKGPERWESFGFELRPYRTHGTEVVLLPQRGIGPTGVAMPHDWFEQIRSMLPHGYRIRKHPGKAETLSLEDDLQNARAVITWGSGAGLKALAMGIPCVSTWDQWIGAGACIPLGSIRDWDSDILPVDRSDTFRRIAWAMWRIGEIKSGYAISELLKCKGS